MLSENEDWAVNLQLFAFCERPAEVFQVEIPVFLTMCHHSMFQRVFVVVRSCKNLPNVKHHSRKREREREREREVSEWTISTFFSARLFGHTHTKLPCLIRECFCIVF